MKLSELQQYKLRLAHKESSDILREVKAKSLKGDDLVCMKRLEETVSNLEWFLLVSAK